LFILKKCNTSNRWTHYAISVGPTKVSKRLNLELVRQPWQIKRHFGYQFAGFSIR